MKIAEYYIYDKWDKKTFVINGKAKFIDWLNSKASNETNEQNDTLGWYRIFSTKSKMLSYLKKEVA